MAKPGNRLGNKADPVAARRQRKERIRQKAEELDPKGQRNDPISVGRRMTAVNTIAEALHPLNFKERTQVVAAVCEFFALSLTVEN